MVWEHGSAVELLPYMTRALSSRLSIGAGTGWGLVANLKALSRVAVVVAAVAGPKRQESASL